MRVSGLTDPGPPIRLFLAPEGSPAARAAPAWAAGYANGRAGIVVLMPARVPNYPDSTLEEVVRHEVAHVLVARAAGDGELPRWFEEGVAMAAARPWTLEDRGRVAFEVLAAGRDKQGHLDDAFHGGAGDARAAYALSHALVRRLERKAGVDAIPAILARVASGDDFETAFAAVAGESLAAFTAAFWRGQTFWNRWVPFLTSSAALWIGVTILALVAFRRRRQRDAALMRRWEEEDEAAAAAERRRFVRLVRTRLDDDELEQLASAEDDEPVN
jgi:hypothetical protein